MASDKGNNHNARGSRSDKHRENDRHDDRGRDGDNDGRGHESHGNGVGVGHVDHGNGRGYGHDESRRDDDHDDRDHDSRRGHDHHNHGGHNHGGGHNGGGGAGAPSAPQVEEISLSVADKNVNAAQVVANWAAQGVTVRAATGLADNPATWSDAPLGTKNVSFSLTANNTTDTSLYGKHEYSGLGVAAKNGIDGGEIDSLNGSNGVSELMAVSFAKPMAEVTIQLSALFDGHEDRSKPGPDAGPYDSGYIEKAMVVVFNPQGVVVGRVEVSGTVQGLASVTLDADNFGGQIGSVAVVPVNNGAGRSGNNSDFLLRSVSGVTVAQDNVAERPTLSVDDVSGLEDHAIALDVSAALKDVDGSETLSVTISGVPTGAALSAGVNNGGGTWTLTPAQLNGLTITPPADFSGEINLTATAKSVESNGGATATRTASFTVDVAAVADAPTLSVDNASGLEDGAIALDVSAALTDLDGSESLSVTIAGVPEGATLSAGTDNGDGSWTLTPAQLNGLNLTPPVNFGGEINLSVTATATESNGSTATQTAALSVHVEAVADTPILTGAVVETVTLTTPNAGVNPMAVTAAWAAQGVTVRAAVGDADDPATWTDAPLGTKNVSFSLSSQNTGDASQWGSYAYSGLAVNAAGNIDGGEIDIINSGNDALDELMALSFDKPMEAVTLELSALFDGHDDPLIAGPDQGPYDGGYVEKARVTVFGVDGQVLGHADVVGTINGLASVTLNAADFGGLIGSVAVKPLDDGAGRSGNNSDFLLRSVTATPAAELPDASGLEDGAIALDVSAALTDLDGSESLSVTIAGVPEGAVLSAGTDNGDGSWTLNPAQLNGLTITPPTNFSGEINLSVTATATESNGSTATQTAALSVNVDAVADAPTLSVDDASGLEDGAIALDVSAALTDLDGSETLSVTISGVPEGAVLSAGVDNGDGSWTLSADDLAGLTITPPADFAGEINLSVTATATESNGSTATQTAALTVNVDAVADAPTLSVLDSSGSEDTAIALDVSAALTDLDGSESLSVTIAGVPDGATLSAGVDNGDGTWTLSADDLAGLTITPSPNFAGQISLSVTARATESNGSTATQTAALTVNVDAVADAPTLSVLDSSGSEDTAIALDVSAALTDLDGSESLSVTISGVPDGATLSAGVDNGDGSWTLEPADLAGLTITPPANFSGEINLSVTATAVEANGSTATQTAALAVTVEEVADAPTLSVLDSSGSEDTAIALDVSAALTDLDGSETLSVTISGVPDGATLSAGTDNGDGSWTLEPADLAGLTITPPTNFAGQISLSVTATAVEANGSMATQTAALTVNVDAVADAPTLSVLDSSGSEDTAIALDVSAALTDLDGSESLSVTIAGVPEGATLSAGVDNGDGSWTLTPAQLNGLSLTPPADFAGEINLSVTATATESNGSTATQTAALSVNVDAVADAPTLSVLDSSGSEDTAIALDVSAALTDLDGSESLSVTIAGVPDGATLSAGVDNGDGTWTLSADDLAGLTITPPADFAGEINLSVTATATESNGSTATQTAALTVNVDAVADDPTLSVLDSSGSEDTAIALDVSAALTDLDGSESLSVTIAGVPEGATLSAGTDNGDGSWTLTPAQLNGLSLTPPANFSGEINLSVTATATESNGSTATQTAALAVNVDAVADAPTLSVDDASGSEDTAIALDVSAALTDLDGSESLSVTISGVPDGATLSAGVDNGDGSWTLTPAQLNGLNLTPPTNFSGEINLSVTATATESNGSTATQTAVLAVTVEEVADDPTLSIDDAAGAEDSAIALDVAATLPAAAGVGAVLSVVISGVPEGASLSAGTDNGDGAWTLVSDDLVGLTLTPPADFSGEIILNVTATATETDGGAATVSTPLVVTVTGVADQPVLTVADAAGVEDQAVALDISAALVDLDGSETLSITISGVPEGAVLSAGTDNGDGSWTLGAGDLGGLSMTPPPHFSGEINLTVVAKATERDGDAATRQTVLTVTLAGVADQANLIVADASGAEDAAIALNVSTSLADADGSETLSVTISGVPAGAVLSAGTANSDGTWTLDPAQLAGLTITPPQDFAGAFELTVTATSVEADGDVAVRDAKLTVSVAAVADDPVLTVDAASGVEDGAVALDIAAAVGDLDGSEEIAVVISGLPPGAALSAGAQAADGSWTLSTSQLAGLTLTPPANYAGSFNLTVTATATEMNGGDSAVRTTVLPVTIVGVADDPVLSVDDAQGAEDNAIALDIAAALTDLDGSETLSISVSGLPTGAVLSAGVKNPDGSWSLTAAQLNGLTVTPPTNFSGEIALTVKATAREADGDTATVSAGLTVSVAGVADKPTLTATNAAGLEDHAIALNLSSALTDVDGSETLSITIFGAPVGAVLSAGTLNPNGSWTLTAAQLRGLTITPPEDYAGVIQLSATAVATEAGGGQATRNASFNVTVGAVADVPTLTAAPASGAEDGPIALNLSAASTDADGSETLSITISGVPEGAYLSAGTLNANGSWTLTAAQLQGLTITPPADFEGDVNLTVTATAREANGSTASATTAVVVSVGAVADAPVLTAGDVAGLEDAAIDLNLSAVLSDLDGSETLSVTISGVPAGAVLSAGTDNGDGTWSLSAAQLQGLTITPPADFAGEFALTVTATATESNGDTASVSTDVMVSVEAVADEPVLTVEDAVGAFGEPIELNISAALSDLDGSESVTVTVAGVPEDAVLSAGVRNADGSWTLTAADLAGLTLTPNEGFAGGLQLSITATATEAENGDMSSVSAILNVEIGDSPSRIVVSHAANGDGSQNRADSYTLPYGGADSVRTVGGQALDIAGVAAAASVSVTRDRADNPTVVADQGFGSVRNVLVEQEDAGSVTARDFVHAEIVMGGGGASQITVQGGLFADLTTADGDDVINFNSVDAATAGAANSGTVKVRSGAGADTINVNALAGISVAADIAAGDGDDVVTIVNTSNDVVDGGAGNDFLSGGGGDDLLIGGEGNDTLVGGAGLDNLYGGLGDDVLQDADGVAVADGGAGNDRITLAFTLPMGDASVARRVIGGGGDDQITLSSTQLDTRLQIIADSEAAAADDGADVINLTGSYARADVRLGGGNDFYQGDNSGAATSGELVDVVYAGAGDDEVRAGGGNDVVYGEDGADRLYGGFGDDTLYGGEGDDQLWGNGGADVLYGDAGNDILRGFDGDDRLFGNEGNDQLYGENNNDYLDGGAGDDVLDGGAGNDTLIGGTGLFDMLEGGAGADVLTDEDGVLRAGGGSGSDSINITFTDDGGRSDVRVVSGGDGIDAVALVSLDRDLQFAIYGDDEGGDEAGDNKDTVSMAGDYALATVRLGGGDDTYQGDETNTPGVAKVDVVYAGSGADTVKLGVGADYADGGAGDDKLYGGAGNDTLLGGAGEDQIYGDDGSDSIDGGLGLFDRLWGGAGVDTIVDADGALLVDGGTGNDVFNLTYIDDGGQPETVRTVIGGDGLDQITLNAADPDLQFEIYGDGLTSGAGDKADTINMNGNYAKANVWLGGGNDTYQGDNGGSGGTRIDIVYAGAGDDTVRMGGGNDVAYGEEGDDRLSGGDGDDHVYGGAGNDMLWGNLGNDWAEGGDGADTLWGNEGDDMLLGDAGNDTLYGGDGADTIIGGTGDDVMTGGAGGDIFIIRQGDGFDTILDFKAGPDKLDLSDFHFSNAAEALSHAADSANGVVITLDDDQSVTLSGLTLQQINDSMLIV